MNSINAILLLFLFNIIYSKGGGGGGHGGGGHGGGGHGSGRGSSSRGSSHGGSIRRTGSLRNGIGIRFTSSGRYGRSRLWFSNHYVNIHYIGHRNYYSESDYNEEDYNTLNEDIYLIYVINGTFLNNHNKNTFYNNDGHYITFSEYSALPDFLENITEFQNIFGIETKIIMSKNYLINNNNNYTNTSIVEFIDEDIYQKVMIDVVTDVHDVPFYKLFPNFHVDNFLYYLSFISPLILIFYTIYYFFKYNFKFSFKILHLFDLLIFLLMFLFIYIIEIDLNIRNNYQIYLNYHSSNNIFFIIWQIIQLSFNCYLVSLIIEKNNFIQISFILLVLEYCLIEEIGTILILIVFLKVLYFLYTLFSLNEYRKSYLYSINYAELGNQMVKKEIFIKKINIIFAITILLIIFELLLLVDNGYIFYIIQYNFFFILIGVFFFEHLLDSDKINFIKIF